MMRYTSLLFAMIGALIASGQRSPYNGRSVFPPDSTGHYRLLIGGHFHGASTSTSGYPAGTVLASIDAINASGANVLLSTGDLFLRPDRDSARYVSSFFSKLQVPLFNAPGNHDLEGRSFRSPMPQRIDMGGDRILLFDTERDDSDIKGDQLQVLSEVVQEALAGSVRRLFIVTHRPVWAEEEHGYSSLFSGNTRSLTGNNYVKEVLPLLRKAAARTEVFWISGSMAGRAPASLFFQPHESNITYIQSAVRDRLHDALLQVDVTPSDIQWSLLSLTGEEVRPVEQYDAEWWRSQQGKPEAFHWRRIPYLIKKNITSTSFWYGAGTIVLLVLIIAFSSRRLRGRSS